MPRTSIIPTIDRSPKPAAEGLPFVSEKHLRSLSGRWLGDDGRLRLLPASAFLSEDPAALRYWLHWQARYLLPTSEMVDWLQEQIGGRLALEICSGNGDLAHLLGIRGSDSGQQSRRLAASSFYAQAQQPPTRPTPDVHPLEAIQAINRFHPEVVVGAWVTRKFIVGQDTEGVSLANIYGPVEETVIGRVQTYIHIGADHIHGTKTALSLPHEVYRFPWIVSRANYVNPAANVIYVWNRRE